MKMRSVALLLFIISSLTLHAQKAKISGIVTDTEGLPIGVVRVSEKGTANGTYTDDDGRYTLMVSKGDSCVIAFNALGYNTTQRLIPMVSGDMDISVRMRLFSVDLGEVVVTAAQQKSGAMEKIDVKQGRLVADPTGGSIETFLVATATGVSKTNELSTQYSVRGGNYNENLVYVNGTEVYRPQLISSGQQEGLSFINPDLTEKVNFSSGGFDACYGDKMSSILDVVYKQPKEFEGSVAASMLGANVYLGSAIGRFSQVTGFRYKRGSTLLNTLDTKGDYDPTFIDLQTNMNYALTNSLSLNFMGNYSDNKYDFVPSTRKSSYGTVDDAMAFEVFYDGTERDHFRTLFGAATLKYELAKGADIALKVSAYQSKEEETYDIGGEYNLSQVTEDGSDVIGTGSFHEHARDYLLSEVSNVSLVGSFGINTHSFKWGLGYQKEVNHDRIKEWESRDSVGYSLPYNEDRLQVYSNLYSKNDISSNRMSVYLQDTYRLRIDAGLLTLTGGLRASYWDFNDELIVSPRLSVGFIPSSNQKFIFRFATGLYYQSPFYKEFRVTNTDEDGNSYITLNEDIKSQRSIHFVLGGDYSFKTMDRPFKLRAEMYYKKLDELVPYYVDNVRIRYSGFNSSKGYTAGLDMKLFGEFVPGTDSWLGLSLMKAEQDINGEKVPLPTDQRYNITLFFTDYYPNNDRIKLNLNMIWADGLPFAIPGDNYKPVLRSPAYRRIDIGMSYRLWREEDLDYRDSAFLRNFKNIWVGLDVFNLFDIGNVSSYSWFSDIKGYQHAVPDKLTGRQINIKLVADF